MLLTRSLAQTRGLQQAAQLTGQNGGFGGKILRKEILIGVMQKRRRADDFIKDHQRCSHHGTSFKTSGGRKGWVLYQVVDEDGPSSAHRFGGDGTLPRDQSQANEAFGQLASGLLADQFVAGMTAPKINARDLKKFTGRGAKQLNESGSIGSHRSLAGYL